MIKKFKNDDNGISGITSLFILIIIALLVWQIFIPAIDNNTPSFTDFIQTQGDITADWGVLNVNTTDYNSASVSTINYYDTSNVFKIILKSNVPYKILEPYYLSVKIYESGNLIGGLYEPIGFNAIYKNEFIYNINIDTTGTLHYEIQTSIFDYNGNAIEGMPFNAFIHDRI